MIKPFFLKKITEGVYYFDKVKPFIDSKLLEFLKKDAIKNKLKRSRICVHKKPTSKLHEMFIAILRDSYIKPHKHLNKDESYFLLEGKLEIVVFNENGKIKEVICMSTIGKNKKLYFKIFKNSMHTIVIKSKYIIIKEVTEGPLNKKNDVFAHFAPDENQKNEIKIFNIKLNENIKKYKLNHAGK
jgi:cupin fold WbuC family metalloprotein